MKPTAHFHLVKVECILELPTGSGDISEILGSHGAVSQPSGILHLVVSLIDVSEMRALPISP